MITHAATKTARFKATVIYRSNAGPVDVEMWLDELSDLDGPIELGPHWDTIIRIEIVRVNHNEAADLTIESAREI